VNLTLIREDRAFSYSLPDEVTGKHWLCDTNASGRQRKFAAIDAKDGLWEVCPYGNTSFRVGEESEERCLTLASKGGIYPLNTPDGTPAILLVEAPLDSGKNFKKIGFSNETTITIGRDTKNELRFDSPYVSNQHAVLQLENEQFSIIDLGSENGTYVNMRAIPKNTMIPLDFGDVVFIMGLKIMVGNRFIAYNDPKNAVALTSQPSQIAYTPQVFSPSTEELLEDKDSSLFYRSPRIKRDIERKTFAVEAPPAKEAADEESALMKIGPSLGMALGSVMMGLFMLTNVAAGGESLMQALPMASMMIVMVLGAVLWPGLSSRYERRKTIRKEATRKAAYATYLDKIRMALQEEMTLQREILEENRITVAECLRRAYYQDRRLFERTVLHSDFLELRLGRGVASLDAEVSFPQDKLELEEDVLKSLVNELAQQPRVLSDVPLSISFVDNHVCGVVGKKNDYYPFLRGLIAQVCALHAPDEVKIVFFGDAEDEHEWQFVRALPHLFDISFSSRFLVTEHTETADITLRLEREIQQRNDAQGKHPGDYGTYYIVIAANGELTSTSDILTKLNALRENKGFTVVTFAEQIRELPKECTRIVELTGRNGLLYDPRDASGEQSVFTSDIELDAEQAQHFAESLAAVKLEEHAETRNALPTSLGFLEMFMAGKIEHLNIKTRWLESNPTISLATPLGLDPMGEFSQLDIHEDFHGPHGLIAGTTGSGKSETIITYVLSLAVNYRPDEVSFILIDYKGGGLAGAFENDITRLPHLAGTITNLDGSAIRRSLVSINSELRRRQDTFNQAREIAGESTMDIYKYQALYREGKVSEPVPHLVVVADEFAELKSQEPEFMDELISAARIGRSLGVHLILATQKPSGVVNDQIWSNSKFKICLKVSDADDSREMLKRTDAAELVDAGRYYLQVGYNEYFAMGQSAYAGAQYAPKEEFVPPSDNNILYINNNGRPLVSAKPEAPQQKSSQKSKIPEARAVLVHIAEVAEQMGIEAPRLWLPALPDHITVDELRKKYPQEKVDAFVLDPIIGELDDPANQDQRLLTFPLSLEGNAALYGSSEMGVESTLAAMLYDLLSVHSPETLSVYLMDCGAEYLGVFKDAPQVGGVVFATEEEKARRLFRFLKGELAARKTLFASLGGGFIASNNKLQEKKPSILVIINNMAAFYEVYENYEDELVALTRDANRYGIYFLVTAPTQFSMRFRLSANFRLELVIQPSDEDEYGNVLGSMFGVVAPKGFARGLIRQEGGIFEFQGASMAQSDIDELDFLASLFDKTKSKTSDTAQSLPSLPDVLTQNMLTELSKNCSSLAIPFGLSEETLEPVVFDFAEQVIKRMMFMQTASATRFLEAFMARVSTRDSFNVSLIDVSDMFSDMELPSKITRIEETADRVGALKELGKQQGTKGNVDLVIITGIASFFMNESSEDTEEMQASIQRLKLSGSTRILLVDSVGNAAEYVYDAWFLEHSSTEEGLWIGKGLNSHTAISLNYSSKMPEVNIPDDMGYWIVGGLSNFVKLLSPGIE
jgi:S-DNA-T family DNA segregation ATPase FtsK/SpoIIIE